MTTVLERATAPWNSRGEVVEDRTPSAKRRLERLVSEPGFGRIEWERPGPSAAFSRRDSSSPGFAKAVEAVRSRGFTPFVRPVGGRLAVYHDGCLVVDVLTRNADSHPGTTARFRTASEALALGLCWLGVDARVGPVPGEYCPGDWSVNAGGSRKLVGIGQRLVRDAVLLTAVIVVSDPEPLRRTMTEAYEHLGLDFDPATVGAISDDLPGITLDEVKEVLSEALGTTLHLDAPHLDGDRQVLAPWDPR